MANASHVVKIDGTKKGWPQRFNNLEVTFPTLTGDETPEQATEIVRKLAATDRAYVLFLQSAVERAGPSALRLWLNGKDVPSGTSREDRKKAKQRSATVSKEQVVAFGTGFKIEEPRRGSGVGGKVKAAEAAARREREGKEAATNMLLETLRELNANKATKALAEAQLAKLKASGVFAPDFTL